MIWHINITLIERHTVTEKYFSIIASQTLTVFEKIKKKTQHLID